MKMFSAMRTPFLALCFIGVFVISTRAELFTAISDVEQLLRTHNKIIDDLDEYIELEEKRIAVLKSHLKVYQTEHQKAMEDIPNYLGNPINAFTIIKSLTTDLDFIQKKMDLATENANNITLIFENDEFIKYPTLEDLTGAALALTRLQDTYHLNVNDLAQGMLNGIVYRDDKARYSDVNSIAFFTPMKSDDCYELGKVLYNEKDYKNALAWMLVALEKYPDDDELYNFTDIDILEYIGFSYYLLGDIRKALYWTSRLLIMDPFHDRAKGNIPHYEEALNKKEAEMREKRRGDTGDLSDESKEDEKPPEPTKYEKERKVYESLCRGEMEIPKEISKKLTCRYLTENHPFLRLAPIKMEYVYLEPDIMVFHDVMNEDEMYEIMMMARPRFRRATVHDPKTGELVPAHYRISKSAWLKDEESPLVNNLSRRIADFTGLSMDSAEELQVVNYGIGGHYEPHFDFARKQESAFENFSGNRIATVLFYMSEVSQGGATVFTELGLSVFPEPGAAVFWLNLHPSGEGDLATRHAACPVLRGSKWVANKWIHQGGQELIKPCDLEYQSEEIIRPLPRPLLKKTFR